jgi:antitoxin MazE
MNQHVKKWGNSLALRLPAQLSASLGLKENDSVEMRQEHGGVFIRKVEEETLDELIERITPENRHDPIDWGPVVGKEIW